MVSNFRKLPVLTSMPAIYQPQSHQILENCKTRISFYSTLAKLPNSEISKYMIHVFEEQFLDGTLGPALLHPNESDVISATIYLRELLPSASSPLLAVLLKFLLGDFVGAERKEEDDVHLLRFKLISRINSPNENMSIASCRFFSSLISLHNPQVLHNLVLRTLQPTSSSSSPFIKRSTSPIANRTQKKEDSGLESLQPSITRFLTLFGSKFAQMTPHPPSSARGTNSSPIPFPASFDNTKNEEPQNDNNPSLDILTETTSTTTNTTSTNNVNISPKNQLNTSYGINNTANNSSGNSEMSGGVGYDAYLVDAQHQVTIFKAACKEWAQTSMVSTQPITYVGLFMEQVLSKLGKTLDQDLDMNLVVTGLFAKLCYYPVLALTFYLMSYQPNVAPGVPTLYGCIEKLLQDVEARARSFVNISACIERARSEMAEPSPNFDHAYNKVPNVELDFNPKRFLQAVIVLEEFCKELAAILQAKVVSGIGVEKKGPMRNVQ